MSTLVLTGDDARAALTQFEAAGIETYAPFDFERQATLPDGSQVTVAFSLAFATSQAMPALAFFVCENRFPQYFWKPEFQSHDNGAQAIAAVYIAADDPDAHVDFLSSLTGGGAERIDGGQRISCGAQELLVMTPTRIRALVPEFRLEPGIGPMFAGLAITSPVAEAHVVPAAEACGIFIEWRGA